jgi:hypothetical protein
MEGLNLIMGTLAGLLVAVLIFGFAWSLVARARRGNRQVRERRNDPHADVRHIHTARDHDQRRDIPQ